MVIRCDDDERLPMFLLTQLAYASKFIERVLNVRLDTDDAFLGNAKAEQNALILIEVGEKLDSSLPQGYDV